MSNDIHPTKLAILQAAVSVFGQKGFNGATTKEIAQVAGIAEGTIFRHFPSKPDILYGVVDSFIPLIGVDTLKKTIAECQDLDPEEALQHIIRNRFETIHESKDLIRIILTEIQYDVKLREIYIERVYKPIRQLISDFFAERVKTGHFRDINPGFPTILIFSVILFAIGNQLLLDNEPESNFLQTDALTDILLNGIRRSESDA